MDYHIIRYRIIEIWIIDPEETAASHASIVIGQVAKEKSCNTSIELHRCKVVF
jgi:hypothetical protein